MSDAIEYYSKYLDKNGYAMATHGGTSRVAYILDWIEELAPKGAKILDVGCGDMTLSTMLPDYQWTGIDINVEQSKGKGIQVDLEKTPYPFEDESFDLIVCSEVLEHMFNPLKITQEIRRLLKPNGFYIVSTPNFTYIDHFLEFFDQIRADMKKTWTYEHIRQYSIESHQQIFNEASFEMVRVTGADAHFSRFFSQGRATMRAYIEKLGVRDEHFIETDKLIGAMFPLHNHTLIMVAKPI